MITPHIAMLQVKQLNAQTKESRQVAHLDKVLTFNFMFIDSELQGHVMPANRFLLRLAF